MNDFRRLTGIEAYAPTDNVSELTARTNDEGGDTVFESRLKVRRLSSADVVPVLSAGGGDAAPITPHAEAFQAVVWHAPVSHPSLKTTATQWEPVNQEAR